MKILVAGKEEAFFGPFKKKPKKDYKNMRERPVPKPEPKKSTRDHKSDYGLHSGKAHATAKDVDAALALFCKSLGNKVLARAMKSAKGVKSVSGARKAKLAPGIYGWFTYETLDGKPACSFIIDGEQAGLGTETLLNVNGANDPGWDPNRVADATNTKLERMSESLSIIREKYRHLFALSTILD